MSYVLIDLQTGTVLDPSGVVHVPIDQMSSSELNALDFGSDAEIAALGMEYGKPLFDHEGGLL